MHALAVAGPPVEPRALEAHAAAAREPFAVGAREAARAAVLPVCLQVGADAVAGRLARVRGASYRAGGRWCV